MREAITSSTLSRFMAGPLHDRLLMQRPESRVGQIADFSQCRLPLVRVVLYQNCQMLCTGKHPYYTGLSPLIFCLSTLTFYQISTGPNSFCISPPRENMAVTVPSIPLIGIFHLRSLFFHFIGSYRYTKRRLMSNGNLYNVAFFNRFKNPISFLQNIWNFGWLFSISLVINLSPKANISSLQIL